VEHAQDGRTWSTRVFGRFKLSRNWDEDGLELVDPAGRRTLLNHDTTGSVRRRCSNGTVELLQYDSDGRLVARLAYRRDAFGRLVSRSARYTYTAEGDLLEVSDSARGTTRYEVDAAHRLVAEITPRDERFTYRQDSAGNVLAKPGLLGLTIGDGNRLVDSADETFEHDDRNHLAERRRRDKSIVRYRYDSFDLLVRLERIGRGGVAEPPWEAAYDAMGRRLCSRTGESKRQFYWDGDRLAAEVFPDGHVRIYQYASRESLVPMGFTEYDHQEAAQSSGRSYHVFSNPVGMPLHIENEQGDVVWWACRIDPYGSIELRPGATLEYNLRWPGHYYDPETGLHYNRYRYYDPLLGRYLQSDPIGYKGSPVNLYAYCANPSVQVDLLGLDHPDNAGDPPAPKEGPEGQNAQEQTKTPPAALPDETPEGGAPGALPSKAEALAQAKIDAGIPPDKPPDDVRVVRLTDMFGKQILTADYQPIFTEEQDFLMPDGSIITIQDHQTGHQFGEEGGVGDQPPHFNVRPGDNTRTGFVPGTQSHYPYQDPGTEGD
jgi:RHS repeat-associated protein